MTMMKQTRPFKIRYYNLMEKDAIFKNYNTGLFKWNIPALELKDSEISIQSYHSFPQDDWIDIRLNNIPVLNYYDSDGKPAILHTTDGSKHDANIINPVKLQISNQVVNEIALEVVFPQEHITNVQGYWSVCLKICDYYPEVVESNYFNDANQRFARDLANLNL